MPCLSAIRGLGVPTAKRYQVPGSAIVQKSRFFRPPALTAPGYLAQSAAFRTTCRGCRAKVPCIWDLALSAPPEAPDGNPIDWAIEGRDYAIDWAIDWAITVSPPRNGVLDNPDNPADLDILGR